MTGFDATERKPRRGSEIYSEREPRKWAED